MVFSRQLVGRRWIGWEVEGSIDVTFCRWLVIGRLIIKKRKHDIVKKNDIETVLVKLKSLN